MGCAYIHNENSLKGTPKKRPREARGSRESRVSNGTILPSKPPKEQEEDDDMSGIKGEVTQKWIAIRNSN